MQNQKLTNMEIEYLAILYEYRENGFNRITTSEITSRTFVTIGSVSSNLKKLKLKKFDGENLINYTKSYGVSLTKAGQKTAGQIIRNRRIGEIFLKHLGYDFYAIQNQIYKIIFSNDLANSIEEEYFMFEKEKRCSHGYLLPDKSGVYQFEQLKTLDQFDVDSKVKIVKIPESPFYYIPKYSLSEINYIMDIYNNKLVPDKIVRIMSKDEEFIDVEIELDIASIQIKNLADQIYVIKVI